MRNKLESCKVGPKIFKRNFYYGPLYTDVSDVQLVGYSDSDWASNLDDKKSTSGYSFNIGSGVISWSNKKQ